MSKMKIRNAYLDTDETVTKTLKQIPLFKNDSEALERKAKHSKEKES